LHLVDIGFVGLLLLHVEFLLFFVFFLLVNLLLHFLEFLGGFLQLVLLLPFFNRVFLVGDGNLDRIEGLLDSLVEDGGVGLGLDLDGLDGGNQVLYLVQIFPVLELSDQPFAVVFLPAVFPAHVFLTPLAAVGLADQKFLVPALVHVLALLPLVVVPATVLSLLAGVLLDLEVNILTRLYTPLQIEMLALLKHVALG